MTASPSMPHRISSGATSFYKRFFPILWFGVPAAIVIIGVVGGLTKGFPRQVLPVFVIIPTVFTVVGLLLRRLFADLLDEVDDGGDYLVFKNRDEQEQVPLTNIMNVGFTMPSNPPRVTLRLAKPCRFGLEVSFMPPRQSMFNPFVRNPMIDDLIVRVDRARMRRVA
jgi:hypothetical protein